MQQHQPEINNMIKHVGKHNQRRVAIVYRKVPDESHMALVVYTDSLPSMVHDEAMKCLESEVGQNAKELADALFRTTMADGTNCLTSLHKGGWLKKVPTNQVIVTPTAKSTCRLDELNDILDKLEAGGEAAKTLADMDANRGIRGSKVTEGREVGTPASLATTSADMSGDVASTGVLSDSDLASMNLTQAEQMEAQAKTLLAEAKRLKDEAKSLTPAKAKNVRATKKATA
jgi:hypothetical protein